MERKIIRQWLRAGVMEEGQIRTETAGTPQGGVISPLLANAYLNELDKKWMKEGITDRSGWNAQVVRYADDLVILTDKSLTIPMEMLRQFLLEMGLQLHPEKTRIVDADRESFNFLGFNFRKEWNRGRTKRFTLYIPSTKAQASMRTKIRELTQYERTKALADVIEEINPVIRGGVNYFRIGNSAGTFHEMRQYIVMKLMRYIRRKQLKRGFGWKIWTSDIFYGRYGLYYDYGIPWTARGATC